MFLFYQFSIMFYFLLIFFNDPVLIVACRKENKYYRYCCYTIMIHK